MKATTKNFYVYGIHEQEPHDPDWEGIGEGFVVLQKGLFVADGMKLTLCNGHRYILIQPKEHPFWIVLEKVPGYQGVTAQRYCRKETKLVYCSEADPSDLERIFTIWNGYVIPWQINLYAMEFGSSSPFYEVPSLYPKHHVTDLAA